MTKISDALLEQKIYTLALFDGYEVWENSTGENIKLAKPRDEIQRAYWLSVGSKLSTKLPNGNIRYIPFLPSYYSSYDAILPIIQKQDRPIRRKIMKSLFSREDDEIDNMFKALKQTPAQLADALLVATGKFEP